MRPAQIFRVISKLRERYPVSVMCDFYSVSRRGYYNYEEKSKFESPDLPLVE